MFKKIASTGTQIFFIVCILLGLFLVAGSMFPDYVGYQVRVVESGSMEPTISTGSLVVLRSTDTYVDGDIVTFRRGGVGEVITHRIVAVEISATGTQYRTQGDANNVADRRPITEDDILGRVGWHIPYIGYILAFIRTPVGFVLFVGLPALVVMYEEARRIMSELQKKKEH